MQRNFKPEFAEIFLNKICANELLITDLLKNNILSEMQAIIKFIDRLALNNCHFNKLYIL